MKFTLVVFLTFVIAIASASTLYDADLDDEWEAFKREHNKVYPNQAEENRRRGIFEKNIQFIRSHNAKTLSGQASHLVAINKFGDLEDNEFHQTAKGFDSSLPKKSTTNVHKPTQQALPATVDWRQKGYVTPVKNQGQCGSCWAFSTVASLEGQHFKKTGKLVSLSEQNLVDCASAYGNNGCNGGLMDNAFEYIKATGGIDTEASYPYDAKVGTCASNQANFGATVSGFVNVQSGDEQALQHAIATIGPISVAIDASHPSLKFYSSGVYAEPACSSTKLDHGVTVVGYGSQNGHEYYIVKNSWGPSWGVNGYLLLARNASNKCGIATAASYPTV